MLLAHQFRVFPHDALSQIVVGKWRDTDSVLSYLLNIIEYVDVTHCLPLSFLHSVLICSHFYMPDTVKTILG